MRNIKYAFRNLRRDKFYSLLNGVGLTVGMTVALLIFMWVQDEISYDKYHSKNGRNFLVLNSMSFGGERSYGISTPAPLAVDAKAQVPEIQHVARTWIVWNAVLRSDNFLIKPKKTHLANPAIFEIMDFEFLQGDAKNALYNPNSIVLTKGLAYKIFGDENPMGKTLRLRDLLDVKVTGVIADLPHNTHLQVDCFIPFQENNKLFLHQSSLGWNASNFKTYLLLRPNADPKVVNDKITKLIPNNENVEIAEKTLFELQPISEIYLGSEKIKYGFEKGDWSYIKLFGLIGFIILLIASINYINLTTARATHRAKAAGIRKVIGASRSQLIRQHLLEAVSLVGICTVGALLLTYFCIPFFNEISGKVFSFEALVATNTLLLLGGIALMTILLSGIQPALKLSAFKPVEVLKGNNFKGSAGKGGVRKILVVTQFVSSAALIICTIFMLRQMNYVQNIKLGYEKENIFSFYYPNKDKFIFQEKLKEQSQISDATITDQYLIDINSQMGGFDWEGKETDDDLSIYQINAEYGFKDFFGIEMTEGRWFNEGNKDMESYILNETAVKILQLENPIGKWIDFGGGRGTIVGIVKDFHFRSVHHDIDQLIIRQAPWISRMYVKTKAEQTTAAIAATESIFKTHAPNAVFEYEFMDESYHALYKNEAKVSQLFFLFALVAIIISCLGIFGLATYTAERRFKEIGIRKVLGASVISIVKLLSKDFLSLVVIALLLAIPFAWYFMNGWLNNFAYHINLDWWVFALAGMLAIGIALLTVGFQSVRAALNNPVDSLKNE